MSSTVEEIIDQWEQDAHIDQTTVKNASIETPLLHAKYIRMLAVWKQRRTTLKYKLNEMRQLKTRYYRGEMSIPELKQYGWTQWTYSKPLKTELENILNADSDVVQIALQLESVDTIIETLESILNIIKNRNFDISNYIKLLLFENGGN